MDIGILLSNTMRYSFSDLKKVIILGLLLLLSFLIIPLLLIWGYGFRVIRNSLSGSNQLPEFNDWKEMFIDGVKVFLIQLAYFIIPVLIVSFGIITALYPLLVSDGITLLNLELMIGTLGGTLLLGCVFFVILSFFFYIALAHMANNNSELKYAFKYREIMEMINRIGWVDYIVWYISLILVGAGLWILISIFSIVPVLGWLVMILVIIPYFFLFYYRATALVYKSGFNDIDS